MGFLDKLLQQGAEIAAAVVEKADALGVPESLRRDFEDKATRTVFKVVDKAVAKKEEFDRNAGQKLGDFVNALGSVLETVLGPELGAKEPAATVQQAPAVLEKPVLKAPTAAAPVVAEAPKAAKKRATTPKKRATGKKLTS